MALDIIDLKLLDTIGISFFLNMYKFCKFWKTD